PFPLQTLRIRKTCDDPVIIKVNVTCDAEDETNEFMDAHADSNADEEDAPLVEIILHSPFSGLIKDLYQHYGHDQDKMMLRTMPISSPLVKELYDHAKHLLDNWSDGGLIHQKHLLVALSCVVNTIDGENAAFYENFTSLKKSCIVEGFIAPSERQLSFVQKILDETNFILSPDLDILDIWVLRHACDVGVSLRKQSPFFQIPNLNALKEELTICSVIHILALYHGDVIPRMGELSSQAVRSDRRRVESAVTRDRASMQARGRTTQSLGALDRRHSTYPLPSPLLLDIAGRTALPYKILKVEPDVFVAGAVMENKELICLPRSKEDIVDFLKEGGISALLNIKHINDDYAATVKEALRKVKRERNKNKMLGYESLDEGRNPIINTPVKRYRVSPQRTPMPRKPRLKSPAKVK
ncbi:hypothetical protein DFQ26_007313, partial [Actinomortierella ambigua]